MKTLIKKCIVCGKEFTKKVNCSKKNWKISRFCSRVCINKGRIPWNKRNDFATICPNCGIKFRKRNWDDKYCSRKCARTNQIITTESRKKAMATRRARYGYINSPETREKMSQIFSGSKSHLWKGGKSKENYRLRRTAKYKSWRNRVFERDNYTCQMCGQRGGELHPHHIKSWEKYPKLRFIVSNGQTLCILCHKQTDSFAKNLK